LRVAAQAYAVAFRALRFASQRLVLFTGLLGLSVDIRQFAGVCCCCDAENSRRRHKSRFHARPPSSVVATGDWIGRASYLFPSKMIINEIRKFHVRQRLTTTPATAQTAASHSAERNSLSSERQRRRRRPVITQVGRGFNTPIDYRCQRHFKAKNGRAGMGKHRCGANGDDIVLHSIIRLRVRVSGRAAGSALPEFAYP
jgi:hypothetical protein